MTTKNSTYAFALMAFVITGNVMTSPSAIAGEDLSPYVSEKGDINFPENFRLSMVHLGSWFVPDGGASGFHDVYTERESLEAYRKTGEFPDGATLVKELRAADKGDYTTGQGVSHSNSTIKQWFVMIKNRESQFEDNGLWGDGWGWALFKPDNKQLNLASNYKTDCLGCHIPAKQNDWIYKEAYPILDE